jgi:hypothetical protein
LGLSLWRAYVTLVLSLWGSCRWLSLSGFSLSGHEALAPSLWRGSRRIGPLFVGIVPLAQAYMLREDGKSFVPFDM